MSGRTPMMEQYEETRRGLGPGTLLLFRLGDFFELFDDDAKIASDSCGLTLTHRQGRPMAGLPAHAIEAYLPRLLATGRRVALCDQVEAARPGVLVRREVTRILSPGTALEDHQLDARRASYLVAAQLDRHGLHAAWLDLSTGDFQLATDPRPDELLPLLAALDARELLLPEGFAKALADPARAGFATAWQVFAEGKASTPRPAWEFDVAGGLRAVAEVLGTLTLDGFGIARDHPALGPAGALVAYATESLRGRPAHLRTLRELRRGQTVLLDPVTVRHLELFRGATGQREDSVLATVDGTVTAPGARRLEHWLATPTRDLAEIRRRQDLVDAFLADPAAAGELQEHLRGIRDLHRILGRIQNKVRHPRELGGVRDTLAQLPLVHAVLDALALEPLAPGAPPSGPAAAIAALRASVGAFPALQAELAASLADELPGELADGGVIRDGRDPELDRLRDLQRNQRKWLTEFEASEQARTGIRNLRIRHHGTLGYTLEVTKSNLANVPADWIRRQSMANGERYTTPALREMEKELGQAADLALAREAELFAGLVAAVLAEADALRRTADALAELDVVLGWARLAREHDWVRPVVDESDLVRVVAGRHPVVERTLRRSRHGLAGTRDFVPNDTDLASSGAQVMLLTGPNMAGKSTYIRQVALLAFLAHVGCPVPAKAARFGVLDRIFTRVGASDELARGNSTFMVEMNETANILHHATHRSLVVLDEIGRGTSTYDGLSIAWAVLEHLHGGGDRGPVTLFATHYHELTRVAEVLPRVRNACVAVKEWEGRIVFVRQVIPGAADRSYGIHVARLAGLPDPVLARAETILADLEAGRAIEVKAPAAPQRPKRQPRATANEDEGQLGLFA